MRLRSLIPILVFLALETARAEAADFYTGAEPARSADDWIVSFDTSVDITSQNSVFADVTGTMAATGTLAESGARVRVDALGGTYSYRSNQTGSTIHGGQESGAVLVGYEWMAPDLAMSAYIGGDARHNSLSPADQQNSVVGTSFGVKGSLEFYARPTEFTIVSGYASYATNKNAYFTRLRTGYLVAPNLALGPEVAALGDAFFNQERVGLHLSGFRLGGVQLSVAGGYLYDRVRKSGGYTTVDARFGF